MGATDQSAMLNGVERVEKGLNEQDEIGFEELRPGTAERLLRFDL